MAKTMFRCFFFRFFVLRFQEFLIFTDGWRQRVFIAGSFRTNQQSGLSEFYSGKFSATECSLIVASATMKSLTSFHDDSSFLVPTSVQLRCTHSCMNAGQKLQINVQRLKFVVTFLSYCWFCFGLFLLAVTGPFQN